ncbi:MAG: Hpt domain-containing protein [Candidatus Omnitrophica bacterium]|nr:Hpt domain-containing protein [Candidatus Omnitrophota bacterium]
MNPKDMSGDKELMDLFYEETQELIDAMIKNLSDLKDNPQPPDLGGQVKEMFRCTHIIKSSSDTVGFDSLQKVAQCLENVFKAGLDENFKITPERISLFLEGIEACQKLLKKQEGCNYEELIERLNKEVPNRGGFDG